VSLACGELVELKWDARERNGLLGRDVAAAVERVLQRWVRSRFHEAEDVVRRTMSVLT